MAKRGCYSGAAYSSEAKEVLGAIGRGLRDRGWTGADVKSFFSDAGYDIGDETLRQWANASGAGRPIITNAKKTGARKKLDNEGRRVAAGWVLSQEKKVDLRRYRAFVEDELDVSISPASASRYLAEFDISRRMLGSRPRDIGVSFGQYAKEGYDYVVGLHNNGFFLRDPSSSGQLILRARPSSSSTISRMGRKAENNKNMQGCAHLHGQHLYGSSFGWVHHSTARIYSQPTASPQLASAGTTVSKIRC